MRVKTLPASTVPVQKCNHRWGAKATFSHQTDSRLISSIYAAEMYGFRNNVRLGAFINNTIGQNNSGIDVVEETGLMRHDIYFGTDRWVNPETGVQEAIPDHFSTAWTSAGVAAFPEQAVLGASKATRTPTHGKQMFDLTNGRLGFDTATGTMGTSNLSEYWGLVEYMNALIIDNTGRVPSAGSCRNGVQGSVNIMYTTYLGMRNSSAGGITANAPADTWYGQGLGYANTPGERDFRDFMRTYPSTSRWWDYWNTWSTPPLPKQEATDYFIRELLSCIDLGGWYRDFCHWHSCRNTGTMPSIDEFLQTFRSTVGSNFIWTCSNGEALEYAYARELANQLGAFEKDGKVYVFSDFTDPWKGTLSDGGFPKDTPMQTMNTPLSVTIDLSGTSLSGKQIRSSFGKLRALGGDQYIAEIPFHKREGLSSIELSEGTGGVHIESAPTGTASIQGTSLTIDCDMPVKAVLFSVSQGGNDYDSLPDFRSNIFSTEHNFSIQTGRDYRIGIISEFGQSSLIEL